MQFLVGDLSGSGNLEEPAEREGLENSSTHSDNYIKEAPISAILKIKSFY